MKYFSSGRNHLEVAKLHAAAIQIRLPGMKALATFALILALLTFGALTAFPQAETGQILGTVTDPSGASIPGAKVTVRSVATGAERAGTTDALGNFTFPNLLPDTYDVSVSAPGFSSLRQRATVTVGTKVGLDLKLEVGKAETVVEVTGVSAAVTVNTETQTISQVLTTQQLLELPTITRNPYALVVTSGNVSEDDPTGGGGTGRGAGVTMNGEEENARRAGDGENSEAAKLEYLLVEAGGRKAAVPLADVLRIEQLEISRIEYIGQRPVLNFEGHLLPVEDSGGVLAAKECNPEAQIIVVVCREGKRHVGIAVSHVLDVAAGGDLFEAGTSQRAGGVTLLNHRVTGLVDLSGVAALPAETDASVEWNQIAEALR